MFMNRDRSRYHRSFWIAVAWAVPASLAAPAHGEPTSYRVHSRAVQQLDVKLLDRIESRLSRQLYAAGIAIQEGADPDVLEAGYVAHYHGGNEPWNDILQVSRPDNPLLTDACRERALDRVLDNASDRGAMRDHLEGQVESWDEVRQGARRLRLSEILLHMASCSDGCAPYLSGILSCHIEGVRSRDRAIVYFDADRPRSYEEPYFVFGRRDEERIRALADKALARGKNVILFSRTGGDGAFDAHNISGNSAIAWRRARVVDRMLIAAGMPRDRIQWKNLSWETPRLAAGDVAEAYGFVDDWQSMTDKQSMDQSVVLVVH